MKILCKKGTGIKTSFGHLLIEGDPVGAPVRAVGLEVINVSTSGVGLESGVGSRVGSGVCSVGATVVPSFLAPVGAPVLYEGL